MVKKGAGKKKKKAMGGALRRVFLSKSSKEQGEGRVSGTRYCKNTKKTKKTKKKKKSQKASGTQWKNAGDKNATSGVRTLPEVGGGKSWEAPMRNLAFLGRGVLQSSIEGGKEDLGKKGKVL